MAKFKVLGLLKDPRFDRCVVVWGGPSSVTVHVGNEDEDEGPPAAATAKQQEDDKDTDKNEGVVWGQEIFFFCVFIFYFASGV